MLAGQVPVAILEYIALYSMRLQTWIEIGRLRTWCVNVAIRIMNCWLIPSELVSRTPIVETNQWVFDTAQICGWIQSYCLLVIKHGN